MSPKINNITKSLLSCDKTNDWLWQAIKRHFAFWNEPLWATAAVFFLLTRQSRPVLDKYILQFACVFCNFRGTKGKRTAADEVLCRRLGREKEKRTGGSQGNHAPGNENQIVAEASEKQTWQKWHKCTHTRGKGWTNAPLNEDGKYTQWSEWQAQTHTWVAFPDGYACLQLVLGIFFESIFWSHVWLHACTHSYGAKAAVCFSSGVRLTPDVATDSADHRKGQTTFLLVCWEMIKGGELFFLQEHEKQITKPTTLNVSWKQICKYVLLGLICTQDHPQTFWCQMLELTLILPAVLWASLRRSGFSARLNECVGGNHLHGNQVLRESSQCVFAQNAHYEPLWGWRKYVEGVIPQANLKPEHIVFLLTGKDLSLWYLSLCWNTATKQGVFFPIICLYRNACCVFTFHINRIIETAHKT